MGNESILTERRGQIWIVTINRPAAMNSLDVPAMRLLHDAMTAFRDDSSLSVAVLTGAGDRAFCTGADLKQTLPPQASFAEGYFEPPEQSIELGLYVRAIALGELGIKKPLIAAVNGHALGGGLELALACDLRIADTAATFGLPEPRWATIPAIGGVSRLMRAVPTAVAMNMLLTGDRIDAVEAHRIGLVSDLVDAGTVVAHAVEIADRISKNGPLAVRAVKEAATRSQNVPLTEAVALEQMMWGILRDSYDRVEGRRAFAERRDPNFEGR
jgi:E-phenylitaconyl-CoA hydratase